MVFGRQNSFLLKDRTSSNLLSSPKPRQSISVHSDTRQKQQLADKELNDRIAERFFVKRTRRSTDLSVGSKRNFLMSMVQQMKSASTKIGEIMKRKGFSKNSSFYLGPKKSSNPEDREKFVTPPKCYVCEDCNTKLLNVVAYLKHMRKHKVSIRCSGCNRSFDDVVDKRRHELRCSKKTKLRG